MYVTLCTHSFSGKPYSGLFLSPVRQQFGDSVRFSQRSREGFIANFTKILTGLAVLVSTIPARANENAPVKSYRIPANSPFTRELNTHIYSTGFTWEEAPVERQRTLVADRDAIQKQLDKVRGYQKDYLDPQKFPEYKDLLLFYTMGQPMFYGSASRSITAELENVQAVFQKTAQLESEQRTNKEMETFLQTLQSGETVVNQDLLQQSEAALKKLAETQVEKQKAFDAAARRYRIGLNWTATNGVLNDQNNQILQNNAAYYNTEKDGLLQATGQVALQKAKQAIMIELLSKPVEERPQQLEKLVAQWKAKQEIATQALQEHQKTIPNDLDNLCQNLRQLRHKMLQLHVGPYDQSRISFTPWERQRVSEELAPGIEHMRQAIAYYDTMLAKVKQDNTVDFRLKTEDAAHPWPKNIMIGSAVEQETVAFGEYYFNSLMAALKNRASLPETMTYLNDWGMNQTVNDPNTPYTQIPHTSTQTVSGWKVNDTTKHRKVLIIHGDDNTNDKERFVHAANNIKTQLQSAFHLKDEDFIILKQPDLKTVSATMDQLGQSGGKDHEILIVLAGHGGISRSDAGLKYPNQFKEGGSQGVFASKFDEYGYTEIAISEDYMKDEVKKLSHYDCGIILNLACYSGSWIAHNDLPATTPSKAKKEA